MTALGKILVFFNLIFSLIVGAFVVTVYISQTHWVAAYNDLQQKYAVANASNTAYQKEVADQANYAKNFNDKVLHDAKLESLTGVKADEDSAAKLKKITDAITSAQADAQAQKAAYEQGQKDLSEEKSKNTATNAQLTRALAEVDKRQQESEATKKLLKDETDKNLQMVKDMGKEHDQMVAWKIRAESAELRRNELEKENDRLARDNQKLIASGGTLVSMKKDGPNPPPESVEGLVSEVSASGLVRITVGSDAGLAKGNTLEVYRLNTQTPDQSKYLGRIKIIEVSATQAVGQPMSKTPAPLQPGDTVSSRILGS